MLAAGRLHKIVEFLDYATDQEDSGQENQEPVVRTTRRAAIEPLTGRELWNAQQVQADVTHKITMRYLENLTPVHALRYRGRVFSIVAIVDPGERHEMLEITCKERV